MSIISCTSPSPSGLDLPISSATSEPSWSLCSRSASAHRRTASPRRGAGVVRETVKAACARTTRGSESDGDEGGNRAITWRSAGRTGSRTTETRGEDEERKSDGLGKRVRGRVEQGGRRGIKKKKLTKK